MKKSVFYPLAVLLAALTVTGSLLVPDAAAGAFSAAAGFPLVPLSAALRALCGLGRAGSAFACALWAAAGLVPLYLVARAAQRRKLHAADALTVLLSPLILVVLYLICAPRRMQALFPFLTPEGVPVCRVVLSGVVLSTVLCCAVLQALRALPELGKARLLATARALLLCTAALFVVQTAGSGALELSDALRALREGNTGASAGALLPSRLFAMAHCLAGALPGLLAAEAIRRMLCTLSAAREGLYTPQMLEAARALARWCSRSLAVTLLVCTGLNLLELLFAPLLRSFSVDVILPVASSLLLLFTLVLTRLLEEGGRLQAENDLYI